MLNISAGVMLSASFFSLLMPALKGIMILTTSNLQISFGFVGAMVLGMFVVGIINHLLPHEHEISGHHGSQIQINAAWLFVIAISIHKMPEGLAIGAAYGGINLNNPESLTIGIAIQNIPEGAAASNTVPKMDGTATVGTEMAFARGDHIHPSDTSKVDKVEGKGLSTNDYTNEEKSKLTGIAAGAQVNVIESISVNGQVQSINTKGVNITVPTTVASLSDSGNYALKTDVTNIYKYKGTVASYENLPTEGNTIGDVYNTNDTDMNYAWNGTGWDAMGAIYEVEAITNQKIDEIFAS